MASQKAFQRLSLQDIMKCVVVLWCPDKRPSPPQTSAPGQMCPDKGPADRCPPDRSQAGE